MAQNRGSILNHILDRYALKKESSLDNFQSFLEDIGSPHLHLPPVIHIAGSNGKGSVLAFLNSMLQTAGYKVHTYTSPHLTHVTQRITLAGRPITEQDLCDLLGEIDRAKGAPSLSFFEMMTAAAFLAFSRKPADVVLLETGFGGRLDATNVISGPLCSIITSLSLEHTEFLGETLRDIAREKAGIIKPYKPVITLPQHRDATEVIRAVASVRKAPFYLAKPRSELKEIKLGLLGLHQTDNASLALGALDILPDFKVSEQDRIKGLDTVSWPGRLQRLDQKKWQLPDDCELWIDGAHNPDAATQIAATLKQWDFKPLYLVIALQKTKDAKGFLQPFRGITQDIKTLNLKEHGNFFAAEDLSKTAQNLGFQSQACQSLPEAVNQIRIAASKRPGRILVCGSLYLVGHMLELSQESF